jgi:CHAT domain-containing protein
MSSLPRAGGKVLNNHVSIQPGNLRSSIPWRLHRYGSRVVCLLLSLVICSGAPRKSSPIQDYGTALPPCAEASLLAESARLLYAQGEIKSIHEALTKYGESLQCWQSIRAHSEAAATLRSMGSIYYDIGQYQSAADSYEQAIIESKKIADVRGHALSLLAIGLIDTDSDRANESWARTNEAFSLARDLHDEQIRAQILMNYALGYDSRDDPANAAKYADEALAVAEQLKDSNIHGRALLFAGLIRHNSGKLNEALDYYQRALLVFQRSGQPFWQSRALTSIGNIYAAMGELQQSLDYCEQALTIQKRLGNRRWQGVSFNNIGYAYQELGDLEHALDNYSSALECFREIGHETGQFQTSIFVGNMYRLLGDFEKARQSYQAGQKLNERLNDKKLKAFLLAKLGLLSQAEGNLPDAVKSYSQALDTYGRLGDQRGQVIAQNALGNALYLSGEKENALGHLLQGISLAEKTGDRELEVSVRYNLAQVQKSLGRLDDAKSQIETSLKLIESLRLKLARFELRSSYFASVRQFYELYVDVLMQLHRKAPDQSLDAQAFAVSERARARSLLDSLKESEVNIRADADAALLDEERLVQEQLNNASVRRAHLSANPASAELDEVVKEIDRLTTQYQELEARIRSNSSRYAAAPLPQPFDLQESRRLLDDNSMLLEYMLGDEHSYLWVITASELYSFDLPPRSHIESMVSEFRELLVVNQPVAGETYDQTQARTADAGRRFSSVSTALGEVLLGPLTAQLGNRRLLIVPDGRLQSIPFQALSLPDAGGLPRLLVESHEIIYEPSASALGMVEATKAHRKLASGSVAIFANPVFEPDDPRVRSTESRPANEVKEPQLVKQALRDVGIQAGRIPALPASREEADAIISTVPWRTGLKIVDFQASRNMIGQTNLSQYHIIHFATHGFVDYQHPELSGLVLSMVDEKGAPQDGFLRMHEIYNLRLPVDLVVLSACNTGLGKEVKGEGLIGLTRGFMYAGARGVVASLWKVDDDATAELMKQFYAGMFQRGLTPAAALRDAQLKVRSQKRWESPYYWAAFVIQGEYDQKQLGGTPAYSLRVIPVVTMLVALAFGSLFLFRWKRKKTIRIE